VPGTNISRSLVVVGCEFAFPINYLVGKHWQLTSSPATVKSYSKGLATWLGVCHEIAILLVLEQCTWHRALINSRLPDPKVYSPSDIVFTRHATWLDAAKGCVSKLEYKFTGPWRIVESLKGASYAIEHCQKPSQKEKKHASDLTPYPPKLIPFEPIDGANNRYGQLYKPIGANPFKEASLKGFEPPTPFRAPQNFINLGNHNEFLMAHLG
jgi:hypothetical protein